MVSLSEFIYIAALKGKYTCERAIDDARFKYQVSEKEIQASLELASLFQGEALSMLQHVNPYTLQGLKLHPQQMHWIGILLETAKNNPPLTTTIQGKVDDTLGPYTSTQYRAYDQFSDTRATLTTRFGISENFPHGFSVVGDSSIDRQGGLTFITFPEKPSSPAYVKEILKIPEPTDEWSRHIYLYNAGDRIFSVESCIDDREEISRTGNYYYVGSFHGEGTNRQYALYGSNNNDTVTNITQRSTVGNTAFNFSS